MTALRAFDEAQGEVYGIMPDDSAKMPRRLARQQWPCAARFAGGEGAASLLKLLR